MSEEIKDIRVVPESECCGCAACANACPVDAIRMEEGKEGFVFPKVDLNTCIQCGKCVKTCPVLEIDRPNRKEPDCRAAYGADEIRKVSSSGALYSAGRLCISAGRRGLRCGSSTMSLRSSTGGSLRWRSSALRRPNMCRAG